MKRIKLFSLAAIFCAAAAVGYNTYQQSTMTEEERLMQANIEALSNDDETGYIYYCRCHDDGICYSGSMISFRPNCAKMVTEDPSYFDCSLASGNCS